MVLDLAAPDAAPVHVRRVRGGPRRRRRPTAAARAGASWRRELAALPASRHVTAALAGLGAGSALLYAVVAVPLVTRPGGALGVHLWVFPRLFCAYLAAVWLALRRPPAAGRESGTLAVVLGFGLLFRLILLPTPVYLSSDLYRYLWDGRVQLAGV